MPGVLNVHFDEELADDLEEKKDAVYRDMATTCLDNILNGLISNGSFITITQVFMYSYPQFEITQRVIKHMHERAPETRWTMEGTNGTRKAFPSFAECLANCNDKKNKKTGKVKKIRYHNKKVRKSEYYVIFIDRLDDLANILDRLKATDSYDINARFVLIYGKFLKQGLRVQTDVLKLMYNRRHFKTMFIMPVNLKTISVTGMLLFHPNEKGHEYSCGRVPRFESVGHCHSGVFKFRPAFRSLTLKRGLNCVQDVQLMYIPPMVISTTSGAEIEILNTVGEKLNISFHYHVQSVSQNWGLMGPLDPTCKVNCSKWTGSLKKIDLDPFLIGVGRVTVTPDRSMHFAFAITYYMEDMLWVVPSAELIPPWASIITIFEWPTWITLFCLVILMGSLTFVYANLCYSSEHNYLHSFSAAIVVSIQIFFTTVVATQPKSNPVRWLFICYAMFMIIVGSLYQSSLVNVLTHPRYEHQIDSEDEVFDSGIGIGGLESRKNIFDNSLSDRDTRIYNNYEIYATENDTEYQWLLTVAKDRDTITILGEHYAQYYIDKKDRRIVEQNGRPKVHLVKNDVLYTEQVSIVFPQTFFLTADFNEIITLLFESGLVQKWRIQYSSFNEEKVKKVAITKETNDGQNETIIEGSGDYDEEDEENNESSTVVITLDHLQGAFAVFMIGNLAGAIAFTCENIYFRIRKLYTRTHVEKQMIKWKRVARQNRVRPAKVKQNFDRYNKKRNPQHKLRFVQQKTPLI